MKHVMFLALLLFVRSKAHGQSVQEREMAWTVCDSAGTPVVFLAKHLVGTPHAQLFLDREFAKVKAISEGVRYCNDLRSPELALLFPLPALQTRVVSEKTPKDENRDHYRPICRIGSEFCEIRPVWTIRRPR